MRGRIVCLVQLVSPFFVFFLSSSSLSSCFLQLSSLVSLCTIFLHSLKIFESHSRSPCYMQKALKHDLRLLDPFLVIRFFYNICHFVSDAFACVYLIIQPFTEYLIVVMFFSRRIISNSNHFLILECGQKVF